MLRKDLPDMVGAVDKDRGIATCFTSGFGLTSDRAAQLKDAGMYAMRISIDSPFEKEHDRIRGRDGAYRDAIAGVKNTQGADMLADMFVVVSPDNIDDLEDFYCLAADMGMQEMSIYEIVAVGRWLEHEDEVITPKDVKSMERFQKRMNRGIDGPRVTSFPYFMGPDMFGCFAGRRWMHVTPAGEVIPCAYTPLSFGNIKEESLSSIWDNMGKHQAYRSNSDYCMMRNPEFRQKYIHTIPKDEILPYRLRNE
jgi:MoaA/NifB/PqqE/SkfB family radical SAM enzyme